MSLIVTLRVSEGMVLGSDSRITETFTNKKKTISYPLSDNANKTFLSKNNIGFSYCGGASIDGVPFSGLAQEFIENFDYENKKTVKEFADELCKCISSKKINDQIIIHFAGYDRTVTGKPSTIIYRSTINVDGTYDVGDPIAGFNAIWNGQPEVLFRLLKRQIITDGEVKTCNSLTINNADGTTTVHNDVYVVEKENSVLFDNVNLSFANYTLQDAIDFVRFAIKTTIDSQRFISMEKTVGGPIDILVIKPQEAKWISSKELK